MYVRVALTARVNSILITGKSSATTDFARPDIVTSFKMLLGRAQ
jgi:hypothetical protein